jgi:hypothetical protein
MRFGTQLSNHPIRHAGKGFIRLFSLLLSPVLGSLLKEIPLFKKIFAAYFRFIQMLFPLDKLPSVSSVKCRSLRDRPEGLPA